MYVTKDYKRDPRTKSLINNNDKDYKDFQSRISILKELKRLKEQNEILFEQLAAANQRIAQLEEKINV